MEAAAAMEAAMEAAAMEAVEEGGDDEDAGEGGDVRLPSNTEQRLSHRARITERANTETEAYPIRQGCLATIDGNHTVPLGPAHASAQLTPAHSIGARAGGSGSAASSIQR